MENTNKKNLIIGYTSKAIQFISEHKILAKTKGVSEYLIARNAAIVTLENVVQVIYNIPVYYYHDVRKPYSNIKFSTWILSHHTSHLLTERERYISFMWMSLLDEFDKLVDAEIIYKDNKDENIKMPSVFDRFYGNYLDKMEILVQIIGDIQTITVEYVYNNKSLIQYYKKIMEMVSLQKASDYEFNKKLKYIKTVKEQLSILKDSQSVSILGYQLEDDVIINNTCKIAYVLLTGSSNIKHTVNITEGITMKEKVDIARFVKDLGKDIRKCVGSVNVLERNLVPFNSFIKTKPSPKFKLRTEFEYDMDFKLGCTALNYMAFICNTPEINGILNRMGD